MSLTSSSSKRFGERAHQDVNIGRVDAKVVAHASTVGTEPSNGMCLINIEEELQSRSSSMWQSIEEGMVRQSAVHIDKKPVGTGSIMHTLYFLLSSTSLGRLTRVPSME